MVNELIQNFEEEIFCNFVNDQFSGTLSRRVVDLPKHENFPWDLARQVGVVESLAGSKGENRPLVVVCVKLGEGDVLTERSSRIRQFTFAKKVLDEAMANPAPGVEGILSQGLFAFYDEEGNFRLSLVYGEAEGTKLKWSSAKRLSFYVAAEQPNKTFRDRAALDWSSFDKLKAAFSVEKLTKEFYTRLFAWYQRAMDDWDVVFPNDLVKDKEPGEVKSEQIIRLITRLMFVWFLKQKGLVPEKLFDPENLKEILKDFDPGKGEAYYRAILQNLFFATLNTEIPERAFAIEGSRQENEEHFGVKIFYRYASEFALDEAEVVGLFQSIPFMNGGLFECLDRDNHYYDGFSRRKGKQARVPNALFFDDKGLIPLLSQYNFTVEENSPGDEEVALDPEMLGKVFENLLAAYNPETNTQARKATGSFYTPREIVNYMVDESLIAHLCTKCGEQHEEVIRALFREGERPADKELCRAMDEALVNAKILDPACGSGAFPMGILLRMVDLLRILRRVPEEQSVYDLKLELIQNCIYGGDIQCIAVQISKLRFFISLVCEQKPTGDASENYGIHTLPNLETKFVAADSLIGLPKEGKDVLDLCTGEIAGLKDELFEVRKRHFSARSYQEKKELRKEDRALRTKIKKTVKRDAGADRSRLELLKKEREKVSDPKWVRLAPTSEQTTLFGDFSDDSAKAELQIDENEAKRKRIDAEIAKEEKKVSLPTTVVDEIADMLASWDPYDQNASATFSDPEWMFNVKNGFDVVIGNPPYVQLQSKQGVLANLYEGAGYQTFGRTADIYCLFYERGFNSLRASGHLCYITSNQWMRTAYGKKLRAFFCEQTRLIKLLDMGEGVFDATTNTNILLIEKNMSLETFPAIAITERNSLEHDKDLEWIMLTPSSDPWIVCCTSEQQIMSKMKGVGTPLKEWEIGIVYGVKTGFNAGFIIDGGKRAQLLKADDSNDEIIKPLLEGHHIKRYKVLPDDQWLLNTHNGYRDVPAVDVNTYPSVKTHLDDVEKNRASGALGEKAKKAKGLFRRDDQGRTPYNLRNCAYIPEFEKEKISWGNLCLSAQFALVEAGVYINAPAPLITPANRYLLAVLNSRLGDYFIRCLGVIRSGGYFEYKPMFVEQLPVPLISDKEQAPFVKLVNRIVTAKKADPDADTTSLEAEIDQMVYELYGLTEKEIAIVEESTAAAAKPAKEKAAKKAAAKKKSTRKPQPKLPPSLPGWE